MNGSCVASFWMFHIAQMVELRLILNVDEGKVIRSGYWFCISSDVLSVTVTIDMHDCIH